MTQVMTLNLKTCKISWQFAAFPHICNSYSIYVLALIDHTHFCCVKTANRLLVFTIFFLLLMDYSFQLFPLRVALLEAVSQFLTAMRGHMTELLPCNECKCKWYMQLPCHFCTKKLPVLHVFSFFPPSLYLEGTQVLLNVVCLFLNKQTRAREWQDNVTEGTWVPRAE